MTVRAPLQVRVGDRTMVGGRVAEVTEIYPPEHKLGGGARVRFVDPPRSTAIVRVASLDVVVFGELVRGIP